MQPAPAWELPQPYAPQAFVAHTASESKAPWEPAGGLPATVIKENKQKSKSIDVLHEYNAQAQVSWIWWRQQEKHTGIGTDFKQLG